MNRYVVDTDSDDGDGASDDESPPEAPVKPAKPGVLCTIFFSHYFFTHDGARTIFGRAL